MQWNEFYDTAERLTQGATEADWRSGMSRAYYASFHFFRQFFLAHGVDMGRGAQSHANIYLGLRNCGVQPVASIGSRFDALRAARVWADYDIGRIVRLPTAITSVAESSQIVTDFNQALVIHPPDQVAAAAKAFLIGAGRLRP